MLYNYSAIILRSTPFNDGDLIVSFLTDSGERLVGFAKSAQRPSTKWVSCFEPLSSVNLSLFGKEKLEIQRIIHCDLLKSIEITGQIRLNLVVSCLVEIFDKTAKQGIEDPRLFRLLNVCTESIRNHPDKVLAILAYVEYWVLYCLGVISHSIICSYCGNSTKQLIEFSDDYGWRCVDCSNISPNLSFINGVREHLNLLRYCSSNASPDPTSSSAAMAVTKFLRRYLCTELGNIKSYTVLERLVPDLYLLQN